jgi:ferredoxin-type protein NapG
VEDETISRRQLFTRLFRKAVEKAADAAVESENEDEQEEETCRPPGAVREDVFMARCARCNDCVDACPHDAIFVVADGFDAGTPFMILDEAPCHMCEGFPCAAACSTGSLVKPEGTTWTLGKVAINERHCLAFLGRECVACEGLCPEDAQALTFVANKPQVNEEMCVGCGLCISACPTVPKAIDLNSPVDR